MSSIQNCERCGAQIPTGGRVQGMCPRCLMELAAGASAGANAPGAPATLEELRPLFPGLDVEELIGRGGMGAVYRARQRELDRKVALKILPGDVVSDPSFAERFEREARVLARLDHPNVVRVYDAGRAGGRYYLLMEYVDGVDLRRMIRAGRVPPREALSVVGQVCDALQFAHDQGVVHRDIKPENILVDRRGTVKIADFGLAKILGRAPAEFALTRTDQALGTLHYMAPEQMERPLTVDHRADIYSLGVVFYELLTGELSIGRFQPPSAKVEVDVRLDEVVLRTLEKEPERRYQHASDVKTAVAVASRPAEPVAAAAAVRDTAHAHHAFEHHGEARGEARHRGRRVWPWALGCGCLLLIPLGLIPFLLLGRAQSAGVARAQAMAMQERERALHASAAARETSAQAVTGESLESLLFPEVAAQPSAAFLARFDVPEEAIPAAERVLGDARETYLALEYANTECERRTSSLHLFLPSFAEEVELLERELWANLATLIPERAVDVLRRTDLATALFPFGREPIEIWIERLEEGGYSVTEKRPASGTSFTKRSEKLEEPYAHIWSEIYERGER